MKKVYPVLSLLLIFALWYLAIWVLQVPDYILPSPGMVVQALIEHGSSLANHAWVTAYESLIGLLIACLTAFLTALVMDRLQAVKHLLYPLLVISQTLQTMVLAPLLSLWFGFGILPKVLLVILSSYFPIVIAFSDALSQTSTERMDFLQSLGASRWQIYTIYKIPQAMSGFFSGLKIASSYCVGGAIIGEWISAQAGLGYYMIRAQNSFATDRIFAAIVWVVGLSLLFNTGVRLLESLYYRYLSKGSV